MRIVSMIRHGQASFEADDYDVLSPLGIVQARRVGVHLARARPRLAQLVSGPRKRQIDTARHLREAAREAGADFPEEIVRAEFDELPVREILGASLPELVNHDPTLLALAQSGDLASLRAALSHKALLGGVQRAVRRWADGSVVITGIESPAAFIARVERAMTELAPADGEVTVVVTSGGPIAVPLVRTQHLRLDEAFSRAVRLANASITEFALDGGAPTLLANDPVGHLPPDEVTHV